MADDTYRFLLRMPTSLRDELRAEAEASGKSLNAEIVSRLQESVRPASARRVRFLPAAAVLAASFAAAGALGTAAGAGYAARHSHDASDASFAVDPELRSSVLADLADGS